MIGGVPSRRGRGLYITGVSGALQADGAGVRRRRGDFKSCGAGERRAGVGVAGRAQGRGLRGPASPSPGPGLNGGEAAAPRTPKRRRLWR